MRNNFRLIKLFICGILLTMTLPLFAEEREHSAEVEKGPHGGRLFIKEDLALELYIFEEGMPPHFRAYIYKNKQISAPNASLRLTLKRFNGERDVITFERSTEFLQSQEVITEPHSFNVNIALNYQGKAYAWEYSTYEGRLTLEPSVLKAANIKVSTAKPATIEKTISVVGKIMPNRDTSAPIYPRYPGIIKAMTVQLGDSVTKNAPLVTIESNESLQTYTILSPIGGTVVQKTATNGELVKGDKLIYEIANLNTVWVDMTLYRKEAPLVKKDMAIAITGDEGHPYSMSKITYISPLGIEDSQTTLARAVLDNNNQQWLPGMYIKAAITIRQKPVSIAVPLGAVQHWRDWNVVFVRQGNQFEATPIVLGEQDDKQVEIISGLQEGQEYVTENSFFLKADLGKNIANHDH